MFYNIRKKLNLGLFNLLTRSVRKKARIEIDPDSPLMVVTLLCDSDVNMYLVALASFTRFVKANRIVVVSDNLSSQSQAVLRKCVTDIEIVPVEQPREHELPKGRCWERLTYIVKNVPNSYVMQLDADTITLSEPVEVLDALKSNTNFTIIANPDSRLMSFTQISDLVADWLYDHVQVKAEQALGTCRDAENRFYVRACAAFTGFSKKSASLEALVDFSKEIEGKLGSSKWSEWGSEQVASNYLVSSSNDLVLLPFKTYPYYKPDMDLDYSKAKVVHFIGSYRFKKGFYLKMAKHIISIL